MTLICLVKATTDTKATHRYTVKVYGSDGLIRTKTMKMTESDSIYGKLRMTGNRFAVRQNNWGPYQTVTEEAFTALVFKWALK